MTRDPHCDGCKADDARDALREQVATLTAERDAARAQLDAFGLAEQVYGVRYDAPHPCPDRVYPVPGYEVAQLLAAEVANTHAMERDVYRSLWRPVSPETTP